MFRLAGAHALSSRNPQHTYWHVIYAVKYITVHQDCVLTFVVVVIGTLIVHAVREGMSIQTQTVSDSFKQCKCRNRAEPSLPVDDWSLLCNSYTIGCPPVRGDNPRALASGLSYVQVDKHGITILYHLHHWRPCTSSDISC